MALHADAAPVTPPTAPPPPVSGREPLARSPPRSSARSTRPTGRRWSPRSTAITHAGAPEWLVDKCDNVNAGNLARCRYGAATAPRTAALVGDSMAISWMPALRAVLEPRGFASRC